LLRRLSGIESDKNSLVLIQKNPKLETNKTDDQDSEIQDSSEAALSEPTFVKHLYKEDLGQFDVDSDKYEDYLGAKGFEDALDDWFFSLQRDKVRPFTKTDDTIIDITSQDDQRISYIKLNNFKEIFENRDYADKFVVL